jgi:hypothetical protein
MDNLGVQLELPGQEGDARAVEAILKAEAPDESLSVVVDDDGAEDEESGPGTPQVPGMVARPTDG